LQQFERFRDLLWNELAVEPASEFVRLHDQILAGGVVRAQRLRPGPQVDARKTIDQTTAMVGREVEFFQLHRVWNTTQSRAGAVILIDAEAGGGKTRLIQEFGLSLSDTLFLTGQCYESTRTAPYRPWVDILRARVDQMDRQALARVSPS